MPYGGDEAGLPADDVHGQLNGVASLKRHNDGANYAFVDGHAKWLKPSAACKTSGDCLMSIEIEP